MFIFINRLHSVIGQFNATQVYFAIINENMCTDLTTLNYYLTIYYFRKISKAYIIFGSKKNAYRGPSKRVVCLVYLNPVLPRLLVLFFVQKRAEVSCI